MDTTPGIQFSDVELVSNILMHVSNTDEANSQATGTEKLGNMNGSKNPENTHDFENTEGNDMNGTETDSSSFVAFNASQVDSTQEAQSTKQPPTPAKQNTGFGFLE